MTVTISVVSAGRDRGIENAKWRKSMTEEEQQRLEQERKEAISKLPPTKESINNEYLNKVGASCRFHGNDCYCNDCMFYRREVFRLTGKQI